MTVSTPDIQALIAAYRKDADEFEHIEELGGQVMRDHAEKLAAALSALSGETETEWEYRVINREQGFSTVEVDLSTAQKQVDEPGDVIERRRKAGPWIEAV